MSASVIYRGAAAPEDLRWEIEQGDSGLDLTTVTAVEFRVRLPDGNDVVWPGAVLGTPTPTRLVAQHVFDPVETEQLGDYTIVVAMTVPGGVWRTVPRVVRVVDPFGQPGC